MREGIGMNEEVCVREGLELIIGAWYEWGREICDEICDESLG